jgi:hypothetical protein
LKRGLKRVRKGRGVSTGTWREGSMGGQDYRGLKEGFNGERGWTGLEGVK